jgi:hypothetical protein
MASTKILLVGEARIGKTKLLLGHNGYVGRNGSHGYTPTMGVDVVPVNVGNTHVNVWELAGDSRYQGSVDRYMIHARGAIILCREFGDDPSIAWESHIRRVCGHIPIYTYRIRDNNDIHQILGRF